jgi:tRNA uridine 5-carboxymethylaminomethyl modification enzyme
MAQATDEAGIQFRILNASKGPAVRATRCQADRVRCTRPPSAPVENQPNLSLFQQAVDDLILEGDGSPASSPRAGCASMRPPWC